MKAIAQIDTQILDASARTMSSRTTRTRLLLIALFCFVCSITNCGRADAAVITVSSWTNDTTYATTDLSFQVDTQDAAISVDAVFRFEINELFGIPSSASIDTTLLALTMDGTFGVTLASHAIELSRNSDGYELPADTTITFVITGLATPLRAGAVDIGRLVVFDAANPSMFELALPQMLVQPGRIWNAEAAFASLISGRASSLQLSLMPANGLLSDGSIVVTLPAVYASVASVSLGLVSGLNGDLTISTRLNQIIITRTAGIGTATRGMQVIVIQVNKILHPLLEGPTGNRMRVDTVDAQSQLVDQVYVDTSALVLQRAQVIVSTQYLKVQEGSSTGSTYTLHLSALPTGDQLTVSISQIASPSTGATVTITPAQVVFSPSNWSTPSTVTVVANDDDVARTAADDVVVVTHSIVEALTTEQTFAPVDSVQVLVQDNDVPLVQVSSRYAAVVQGLRNDSYEVVLTSRPSDSVRIQMDPVDAFITTIPSFVVFSQSAWNTPQRVTIVANAPTAADLLAAHSRRTSVLFSSSSSDPNFNASKLVVAPQSDIQVYYEPLQLDQCVEPCRAGWFSFSNSTTSEILCLPCPLGFFCTGGCANPSACPLGTFSSASFAESALVCQDCPLGSYTNQPGMTKCSVCPSGASCAYRDRVFQPCPAGTWSGENEVQCHECPAGSYNSETFQEQCTTCPVGYYCPKASSSPVACASGTVSINSGVSPCGPCPAGYSCSGSPPQPSACLIGTYSPVGEVTCSSCPRGFFCPQSDQPPQACVLGTVSTVRSTVCNPCPPGSSCANAAVDPVPCALGTYASSTSALICRLCPAGYSCADPSMAPSLCALGAYSLEVSSYFQPTTLLMCEANHHDWCE